MSAPIQGFAEHTIWHEIIMFQFCCEERSWPLILASLPLCISIPPSWSFRGFGEPQQSTLNLATLSSPFIRGLFKRQEAFMITIPPNNDFSYLHWCNLMTAITCCCGKKMKVVENAASRHLSHRKNLKALMNLNEKEKMCGDLPRLSELKEKQNEPQRDGVWGDGSATTTIGKTVLQLLK